MINSINLQNEEKTKKLTQEESFSEIINKKHLIKTKHSKIIIFMRGGILNFSNNKG